MNGTSKSMSGLAKTSLIICLILGVLGFSELWNGMFFHVAKPMSAIFFIIFFIAYLMEDQH